MPDDLWDVITHPREHWTFFIVLVSVVLMVAALAFSMLRLSYVRAHSPVVRDVSGTSGVSTETRLANLEKLHAEGRITAQTLAELKAQIQAED